MLTMNLKDLELYEYKLTDQDWKKLIMKSDSGYVCHLCKSYTLINLQIIRNHLQTKNHTANIKPVVSLYHPKISPNKDSGTPGN